MNTSDLLATEGLSIGALSRATGISIHSLRMWERRYGAPASSRRASGHRRYSVEEVDRLRAVARALAAGFRAGEVVTASIKDIDEMLVQGKAAGGRKKTIEPVETNKTITNRINEWVEATRHYDGRKLVDDFQADWTKLGVSRFVFDRAVPLLMKLGDNWQDGSMAIAHEHFATEQLMDFLSGKWRPVNDLTSGRPFVLGTLLQDLHAVGLELAAALTAFSEFHVVFLGSQVPTEELVETAITCNARAVGVGISKSIPNRFAQTSLQILRRELGDDVDVFCGGTGAPNTIENVTCFNDLQGYHSWLESLRHEEAGAEKPAL